MLQDSPIQADICVQQAITQLTGLFAVSSVVGSGGLLEIMVFSKGYGEVSSRVLLINMMMLVQNQQSSYYHRQSFSLQYQMSKHFRSNLIHWLAKVNSLARRARKTCASKRPGEAEGREPKSLDEEATAECLMKLFQEAKARGEGCQSGKEIVLHFLREEQLSITNKMHDSISQLIERFFSGAEEPPRNHQDFVGNVWNSCTASYECICPRTTRDLQFSEPKEVCYRCGRSCHTNCLWGRDSKEQSYECPLCFLTNCLPNRQVQHILFAGFLRQIKKDKIEYKINLPLEGVSLEQCQLEARCVRLCKDSRYDLAWPMNSALLLNGKKIMDFKPLSINSSLKRRTDDQITFEKRLLEKQNTIVIEEKHQYIEGYRPAVYENHFVVLVVVRTLSVEQMLDRMMDSKVSVEESKEALRQYFNKGSQDCVVDQINVTLRCQLYNLRITIPSRSKHCTSHYQPFDLRSFLISNISLKSSAQRWRCPICRERAYHIIVDQHLLNFIQERPNVDIIEFASTGQPKFFENEDSDNQSQRNQANEKPLKEPQVIQCEEEFIGRALQPPRQPQQKNYSECIELQSENQDNEQTAKKRLFSQRFFQSLSQELDNSLSQKKRKTEQEKQGSLRQPLKEREGDAKEPIREQSGSSSELINFESKYSPENSSSNFKPGKKEKKQRGRRREQPEDERREIEKMAKVLIPSPAISTVTPEAIRILQKKIPDYSKRGQLAPPIEIESDEQNEDFKRARRLEHHRSELAREKGSLTQKTQKCEITAGDELIFLSLCDKFMIGSVRS